MYKTSGVDKSNRVYSNERIRYWFDEVHIDDLLKLRSAIYQVTNVGLYRNFFLCAFSNILKSCSRWLTKSIKPQIDPKKQPKDVLSSYIHQVNMMRKANMENINEEYGEADIIRTNILDIKIDKPFTDLIVTSPPYVTSYEYADLHQLSTLWLEYTDDFRSLREGTIGSLYHSQEFNENLKN